VPQIQRADQNPDNRNVPASDERNPRFQRAEPARAEPASRNYVHEHPQSMPQPTRNEPPRRPAFQPQQRPQQQPRYEPPPRVEAPRPQQRTESRPPPQKNPHRPKDDAGQH
jgi:hypothetical protein